MPRPQLECAHLGTSTCRAYLRLRFRPSTSLPAEQVESAHGQDGVNKRHARAQILQVHSGVHRPAHPQVGRYLGQHLVLSQGQNTRDMYSRMSGGRGRRMKKEVGKK